MLLWRTFQLLCEEVLFSDVARYHIADATHGEVRHFGSTGAEFISV